MRTKSKKPSKQRKHEFSAPLHAKHKMMSAHLSPELREEKGFRSFPLRKDDEVVILRGNKRIKGMRGKITKVLPQERAIHVAKVFDKKTDGTEIPIKIHPSNVMIVKFAKKKDRKRIDAINRRTVDPDARYDYDDFEEEEEVIQFEEGELEDADDDDFELDEDGAIEEEAADEEADESEEAKEE